MDIHPKFFWSVGSAALFGIPMLIAAIRMAATREDRWLNVMIMLLGGLIGWVVGIVISPYDESERAAFSVYAQAISAFVSGYLLSTADPLIKDLLKPDTAKSPLGAFRLMLFIAAALAVIVTTYIYRRYAAIELTIARQVEVSNDTITVRLVDGRTVSAPLAWYPWLQQATPEERSATEFRGNGYRIYWPRLKKEITTDVFLSSTRAPDIPESPKR